ncbi:MAG: energy-coupled thiamine transporter ThiT [Tissierellia bacterium]|nr:energy-coupled thiamine transporter ThiT [Tissierellia bacterium]
MKNQKLLMLVEGGIMIALATVLSFIKLFKMPQGGSITAASMLPIMIFAMRWGVGRGLTVATLYGILQYILEPYFFSPMQVILDYPIAFGLLGLAGIAKGHLSSPRTKIRWILPSCGLGMLGRTIAHVLSGVIFFYEYAGAKNPWLYSIEYNGSFMLVELIITSIIIYAVWDPIQKAIPVRT